MAFLLIDFLPSNVDKDGYSTDLQTRSRKRVKFYEYLQHDCILIGRIEGQYYPLSWATSGKVHPTTMVGHDYSEWDLTPIEKQQIDNIQYLHDKIAYLEDTIVAQRDVIDKVSLWVLSKLGCDTPEQLTISKTNTFRLADVNILELIDLLPQGAWREFLTRHTQYHIDNPNSGGMLPLEDFLKNAKDSV